MDQEASESEKFVDENTIILSRNFLSVRRISFKIEYLRLLRKHNFSQDTSSRVSNGLLWLCFPFIIVPLV
jgi:hypothetical protein